MGASLTEFRTVRCEKVEVDVARRRAPPGRVGVSKNVITTPAVAESGVAVRRENPACQLDDAHSVLRRNSETPSGPISVASPSAAKSTLCETARERRIGADLPVTRVCKAPRPLEAARIGKRRMNPRATARPFHRPTGRLRLARLLGPYLRSSATKSSPSDISQSASIFLTCPSTNAISTIFRSARLTPSSWRNASAAERI